MKGTFRDRLEAAADKVALNGVELFTGLTAAAITRDAGFGRIVGEQARLMLEPDPLIYEQMATEVVSEVLDL